MTEAVLIVFVVDDDPSVRRAIQRLRVLLSSTALLPRVKRIEIDRNYFVT